MVGGDEFSRPGLELLGKMTVTRWEDSSVAIETSLIGGREGLYVTTSTEIESWLQLMIHPLRFEHRVLSYGVVYMAGATCTFDFEIGTAETNPWLLVSKICTF
jgi:hypothetical protein